MWWCGNLVCAQDIAVKTNLLYWATSTPNIGFEFGLGKRTTLDLVGGYNRYEGWATGIGISYGYTWILGKRWNLEANIGAGYIYTKYDKYECKTCGRFKGNQKKHYFGPTKAGISLIYIIK